MQFRSHIARWPEDANIVYGVRQAVFIDEQGVSEAIERDGQDELEGTRHFLGYLNDIPVATGRVLDTGKIGRICVLSEHRGKGCGSALLRDMLFQIFCDAPLSTLYLHAQTSATIFYEKLGFVAGGEPFIEAGIEHRRMTITTKNHSVVATIFGDRVLRLETATEFSAHLTSTLRQGIRSVDILSTTLSPNIYNKEFCSTLSAFVRHNRHAKARVIAHSTTELTGVTHPLVLLSQKLSSSIEIRVLSEPTQQPDEGYAIIDRTYLVFFNNEHEYVGFANYQAKAECQHLLEKFEHLWVYQSRPDPNLKRLTL